MNINHVETMHQLTVHVLQRIKYSHFSLEDKFTYYAGGAEIWI